MVELSKATLQRFGVNGMGFWDTVGKIAKGTVKVATKVNERHQQKMAIKVLQERGY
jgi:hypothetical protein